MKPMAIGLWRGATKVIKGIWAIDSLSGRFARGAAWSLIGAVIAQVAGLAASVITARLLGKIQFGEYGMIQSTVGMLGIFAGLGLGITATKYVAQFRITNPDRAGRIVALSCVVSIFSGGLMALCLLAFAPVLAARTLNAPDLVGKLQIASVYLLFNGINGAQTGVLAGFEDFRMIARINVARGLLTFPVTVMFVLLWRLPGAIWALSATSALTCLFSQFALHRRCVVSGIHVQYSSAWRERRILWSFSTPAFLGSALVGPVTWAANTMLVNLPGGYAEMGVFSAAGQWQIAVLFLPGLLAQVVLPMLSSLQNTGSTNAVRKVLVGSILANALCSVLLLFVLLPCSRWIMSLYGPAYSVHGTVLRILLLSAALLSIQIPVGNFIAAFGRMWVGFFMNAGWAVCFLTIAYILLGAGWGAQALACAYLGAYLAHTLWTFWFAASVLRRFEGTSALSLQLMIGPACPTHFGTEV